jgi:heme A synthase
VTIALAQRDPTFVGAPGQASRALVGGLIGVQLSLGALNLMTLAPLPVQMAHLLVSNLLWIALVWTWVRGTAGNEPYVDGNLTL